jgi:hypothetical protein
VFPCRFDMDNYCIRDTGGIINMCRHHKRGIGFGVTAYKENATNLCTSLHFTFPGKPDSNCNGRLWSRKYRLKDTTEPCSEGRRCFDMDICTKPFGHTFVCRGLYHVLTVWHSPPDKAINRCYSGSTEPRLAAVISLESVRRERRERDEARLERRVSERWIGRGSDEEERND